LQAGYHFFWHEFCDIYIEKAKQQISQAKGADGESTRTILIYVLANSLKFLHPFLPFITEEIYQLLPVENKKTLIIEDWPK
jgi:valyl-tRNA synthetase